MTIRLAALAFALLVCSCSSEDAQPLSTGRSINPDVLAEQDVGSLPVNLIVSADGRYAISTDAGFRQALWSTRSGDGVGVSHVNFPNKRGKDVKP